MTTEALIERVVEDGERLRLLAPHVWAELPNGTAHGSLDHARCRDLQKLAWRVSAAAYDLECRARLKGRRQKEEG